MYESLGSKLRHERERRKIDLNSIADTTKISVALLQGLERDDVKRWPSGIFRKSFVKSYAAAIGLDPEAVLKEFVETFPDPMEPVPSAPDIASAPAVATRARVATFVSDVRARVMSAIPSVAGSVAASVSALVSAARSGAASMSALVSTAGSGAASLSTTVADWASSVSAAAVSASASVNDVSASATDAVARFAARSRTHIVMPTRLLSVVRHTKALPGRLSDAFGQLPPVSVKLTIISTGPTFTNESFLDGMRRRCAAAACDIGISCALASLVFIGVGSFWTPLGVSMMCYYVGGIVILGNTPGVCLFAPVSRGSVRPPGA